MKLSSQDCLESDFSQHESTRLSDFFAFFVTFFITIVLTIYSRHRYIAYNTRQPAVWFGRWTWAPSPTPWSRGPLRVRARPLPGRRRRRQCPTIYTSLSASSTAATIPTATQVRGAPDRRQSSSASVKYVARSPKCIWAPCHVMCTAVYSLAETLESYTRALLVSKDRRHCFVTPLVSSVKSNHTPPTAVHWRKHKASCMV